MHLLVEELAYVSKQVEVKLDSFLDIKGYPSTLLLESMRYSSLGGGKKIRPFLLYFIGKRFGVEEDVLFHIGACLEMVHSYTLIHDDLPSMDDDDMRRGKLSNHKKFGEAVAVLSGDALQGDAYYWLSADTYELPDSLKLKAINLVAELCGGKNLVSGQMMDMEFSISESTEDDLLRISEINLLKTAKIIALPCMLAGLLAGVDASVAKKLERYGNNLGIMFQIIDDIEDMQRDEFSFAKLMGKERAIKFLEELKIETRDIVHDLGNDYSLKMLDLHSVNTFILNRLNNI